MIECDNTFINFILIIPLNTYQTYFIQYLIREKLWLTEAMRKIRIRKNYYEIMEKMKEHIFGIFPL